MKLQKREGKLFRTYDSSLREVYNMSKPRKKKKKKSKNN